MCIPHSRAASFTAEKREKKTAAKSLKRVSQEQFEKGDPDFVDERIESSLKKEDKKGFFTALFSS